MTKRAEPAKRTPLTKEGIISLIETCGNDGHSIFPISAFPEAIQDWVGHFATTFTSSKSDPKGMIFNAAGEKVPSMKGVYTLDLLRAAADEQGAKYEPAYGRGTEARRITEALVALVKEQVNG